MMMRVANGEEGISSRHSAGNGEGPTDEPIVNAFYNGAYYQFFVPLPNHESNGFIRLHSTNWYCGISRGT